MKNYKKNKKILENSFNYNPEMEHDACGVGLIASTNGKKSRKIIDYGRSFQSTQNKMLRYQKPMKKVSQSKRNALSDALQ